MSNPSKEKSIASSRSPILTRSRGKQASQNLKQQAFCDGHCKEKELTQLEDPVSPSVKKDKHKSTHPLLFTDPVYHTIDEDIIPESPRLPKKQPHREDPYSYNPFH